MTPSTSESRAALARLQEDFPDFTIARQTTGDRIRYVARRASPGLRPHTVVTADLDELRTALAGSPPAEAPGR